MKAVLFDLDGTLLPMDMDLFTKTYFGYLVKKVAPLGYEAKELIDQVWKGTACMVRNDGTVPNSVRFWDSFAAHYGEEKRADECYFEEFYRNEFAQAEAVCGKNPVGVECVTYLRAHGIETILATNPIFPWVATDLRMQWAGLEKDWFSMITTYENFNYCKPNPKYYTEILKQRSLQPEDCLMVGNDVDEDMIAAKEAGIKGFLITDCMINKNEQNINEFLHGSFEDLLEYLRAEIDSNGNL